MLLVARPLLQLLLQLGLIYSMLHVELFFKMQYGNVKDVGPVVFLYARIRCWLVYVNSRQLKRILLGQSMFTAFESHILPFEQPYPTLPWPDRIVSRLST